MWFPNRSDTNRPVQAQKRARSLKFWTEVEEIPVAKTKALISFAVTAKLICVFVFAYADCWFSHEAAHLLNRMQAFVYKLKMELKFKNCDSSKVNQVIYSSAPISIPNTKALAQIIFDIWCTQYFQI